MKSILLKMPCVDEDDKRIDLMQTGAGDDGNLHAVASSNEYYRLEIPTDSVINNYAIQLLILGIIDVMMEIGNQFQVALVLFVIWYNTKHLHSGIKFVTPQDRGMWVLIMASWSR